MPINSTVEKKTLAFHPGWIETIVQIKFECEICGRMLSILKDTPYETDEHSLICADCYIRYKEY